MGLREIQIGSIIAVSATMFMIAAPIWGAISEHWGRKPVLLVALCTYFVMTILFAIVVQLGLAGTLPLMAAFSLMILFRVLFTMGISGVFPATQAYMADITTREERTGGMALIGMSMGLGMMAGPAVAAGFSSISLIFPFYAVAGLAVVAGILVWKYIVDVPREPRPRESKPERLLSWEILPFFVTSSLVMTALSTMQQSSAFYFQDKFQLTAAQTAQYVGIGLTASAVASVSAQFFLVNRMGLRPRILLRAGGPIAFIGIALLITMDSYPLLVLGMGVFGIGMGLIMPGNISSISMKAGDHNQGRMAGLNTSAQGFGFIVGPILGSGLYTVHPLLPYGCCLVTLSILIVNVYFVARLPD